MKDTLSFFQDRKQQFEASAQELAQKSKSISAQRVFTAVAAIIIVVLAANNGQSAILFLTLIVASAIFVVLIKKHNSTRKELALQEALQQVNENEVNRSQGKLADLGDGMEFYSAKHPYHEDLDLFGRHSLFQFLNRTSTNDGAQLLSDWLSSPANLEDINTRQESAKELAQMTDFRQHFEAQGFIASEKEGSKEKFIEWLKRPTVIKNAGLLRLVMIIMALGTISSIVLSSMGLVQAGLPLLLIFINFFVLGAVFQPLMNITRETENGHKTIGSLREHLLLLEKTEFKSELNKYLKQQTEQDNKKASGTLSELKFLLDTLHNRANMMYVVFDVILLLDVYWYLRIAKWKKQNHVELEHWFEVIAQFDALNSIAGMTFANPEFHFPEVNEKEFAIEANGMGHPLLHKEKRVSNDFSFHGKGGICLITGSNMSGKSTFLRTLGTNIILAQMGAPVCAHSMEIGKVNVFTSMRTKDELEESVSSFYAELKRLKQLIESINQETPTLFMIDEVLKGTNSDDRHKGALALIRQLNATNAFGLVSTHDLVLGGITNELNGVKNYSFNSQIDGAEIHFDYKLTDGICQSFNASQLMKNMGIQIKD